jgi:hypothetical protein
MLKVIVQQVRWVNVMGQTRTHKASIGFDTVSAGICQCYVGGLVLTLGQLTAETVLLPWGGRLSLLGRSKKASSR